MTKQERRWYFWGWLLLAAVILLSVVALSGCGTCEGFGQDVQELSRAVKTGYFGSPGRTQLPY